MKYNREYILKDIATAILNKEVNEVIEIVESALAAGLDAKEILDKSVVPTIHQITDLFKGDDFYIPDVIFASRAIEAALYVLKPYKKNQVESQKAIIGTVEGDIHDIGKNIAAYFIAFSGFDVIDLGVDVAALQFIQAVKEYRPKILAMSALLTTTMNEMFNVIKLLNIHGLRDTVKVIVGGGPLTKEFALSIGADAYASNPDEITTLIPQVLPYH